MLIFPRKKEVLSELIVDQIHRWQVNNFYGWVDDVYFLELNKLYIKREKSEDSVQSLDRDDSDEEDNFKQQ